MIPKAPDIKENRQDRFVNRAAKRGRRAKMTRVCSPIWTHPSGLLNAAGPPLQPTLDRREKLGNLEVEESPLGECRLSEILFLLLEQHMGVYVGEQVFDTIADASKRLGVSRYRLLSYINLGVLTPPLVLRRGAGTIRYFTEDWYQLNVPRLETKLSGLLRSDPSSQFPPEIPPQGTSARFSIEGGSVVNVPSQFVDQDDNDYRRIRSLKSVILPLVRSARASISRSNAYVSISAILDAYEQAISEPVEEIDYNQLFGLGLALSNAYEELVLNIRNKKSPELDLDQIIPLKSVIDVHGPLILGSEAGRNLVTDAERYSRNPTQERDFQADINDFIGRVLQEPEIISSDTRAFLLGILARQQSHHQPEREYLFRRGAIRNLIIVLAAGSMVAGVASVPLAGPILAASLGVITIEAIKQTESFKSLSLPLKRKLDKISDIMADDLPRSALERLEDIRRFLLENRELVSRTVGQSREMSWFYDVLQWLASPKRTRPKLSVLHGGPDITKDNPGIKKEIALTSGVSLMTTGRVLDEMPARSAIVDRIASSLNEMGFSVSVEVLDSYEEGLKNPPFSA